MSKLSILLLLALCTIATHCGVTRTITTHTSTSSRWVPRTSSRSLFSGSSGRSSGGFFFIGSHTSSGSGGGGSSGSGVNPALLIIGIISAAAIFLGLFWVICKGIGSSGEPDGHFETVTTTTTTVVEEYDDGRPPIAQSFTQTNVATDPFSPPPPHPPTRLNIPPLSSAPPPKVEPPTFDAPPKYNELFK